MAIDEIGLSFDGVQASSLISTNLERNEDTPVQRQERDGKQALQAHDSLVIDNRPLWLKGGLDALITLIGFTGFADGANSQLRGKLIRRTQLTIDQLLQGKLVRRLFGKGHACHVVGCLIEGVHRLKQGVVLFFGWYQFQEHRLFHTSMVASSEKGVNRLWYPGAQALHCGTPIHPPLERRG